MSPLTRGVTACVVAVGGWAAIAAWHPTVNYHLAPALVVSSAPVALLSQPTTSRALVLGLFGSVLTASAALFGLRAAGLLRGPTLGSLSVIHEGFVVIAASALLWFAVLAVRRRRCEAR